MALVYQHYRRDKNHTFYIGIGLDKSRAYSKSGRNEFWKRIFNKTEVDISILIEGISERDAKMWEKYLISLYGRRDLKSGNLVNLTDGGDGTFNVSSYVREKLSRASSGSNNPMFGVSLKGHPNVLRGEKHPFFGKKRSEQSEMMKKKVGHLNSFYGRKHSEVQKSAVSKANSKKKVINTDTGEVYLNVRLAAESVGIKRDHLWSMLNGRYKNTTSFRYL